MQYNAFASFRILILGHNNDYSDRGHVMFFIPRYEQQLYHSRVSNATIQYSSVSLAFCVMFCDEVEGLASNHLTPNVNYSGRTAPLTSKVAFYIFIQQI